MKSGMKTQILLPMQPVKIKVFLIAFVKTRAVNTNLPACMVHADIFRQDL